MLAFSRDDRVIFNTSELLYSREPLNKILNYTTLKYKNEYIFYDNYCECYYLLFSCNFLSGRFNLLI